ncbi:MAG: type II toxin-antitoxin system VapC family toxin [Methanothrix sp.]|nr:type II toxin-antitoxin system VapC family toxin [Methanothrix sp.]
MKWVIDASVFVASARSDEPNYQMSREFLRKTQNYEIYCPTLVLAECAAAISRQTDDPSLAEELVGIIIDLPAINLILLDLPLAIKASTMALKYRLRGADSVYVAVAAAFDAALVTWDKEMLKRGSMAVETSTPDLCCRS